MLAVLLSLSMLLSSLTVPAQAAEDKTGSLSDYVKIIYDNTNGLPATGANMIEQTPDGAVWAGGYAGLSRCNGTDFEYVTRGSMANVTATMVDQDGRLWVGTNDRGVAVLHKDEFHFVAREDGLSENSVRVVFQASDGKTYVGTTDQMCRILPDGTAETMDWGITRARSMAENDYGTMACVDFSGNLTIIQDNKVILQQQLEEMSRQLEEKVREQTSEIREQAQRIAAMQQNVIEGMASLIESRDGSTGEHVRNTGTYVRMIAQEMFRRGMYPEEIDQRYVDTVGEVAPLHDVGKIKIKISDTVLNKPGRFTDEEYASTKGHTAMGGEVVKDILGRGCRPLCAENGPEHLHLPPRALGWQGGSQWQVRHRHSPLRPDHGRGRRLRRPGLQAGVQGRHAGG